MARFVWKLEYETGIPIIDEQHRRLFETLDQVQSAVASERPKVEIWGLIQALMLNSLEHFRTEEALMAHHGYPDLEAHRHEHEMLMERLAELDRRFEEGQDAMALLVTTFMGGWLRHHISEGDFSFVQFMKSGQASAGNSDLLLSLWDQGIITFL